MSDGSRRTLSASLSFVAGMADVTGWLTLGGLFTAHITGNLVVIAADLLAGRVLNVTQALAVPVFVMVAAAIAIGVRSAKPSERMLVNLLLWVQAALLAAAAGAAFLMAPSMKPHGLGAGTVAMLAVAAMGSQNALLHLALKPTPTTSVMTGNVVVAAMSIATAVASGWTDDDARARWRVTWPMLCGFMSGCAAGALMVSAVGDLGWCAAALAAFLCALFSPRDVPTAQRRP